MDPQETSTVLVDTDVYSYLMKPGHPSEPIYRPHVTGKLIAVSFVTVGELLFGARKRGWGKIKVDDLLARLRSVVVVPYDFKVCETYADLKARLAAVGMVVADNDLWIAACAVRHSVPLISNNCAHFEKIPDLVLISEAPVVKEIRSQGN
ncbi:MAG: PIN domain-containing protein, partial [Acidobacteria bacterium]|nr:PIN domain-containing protein [Acidobacteriota bacterium]